MAGITLAQAQDQLTKYLEAEQAVLTGQRYTINGRELVRANLAEIQKGVELWNVRVKTLSVAQTARSRARTVVAR